MILSSLKGLQWKDKISQHYGENEDYYTAQLGRYGITKHNGVDFAAKEGSILHAPFDCDIIFAGEDNTGYGTCIFLTSKERKNGDIVECVMGHLDELKCEAGDEVNMGDIIGHTGNTGMSSGPHLHLGFRKKDRYGVIKDKDNGALGYFDFEPWTIWWE